MDAMREPHNHEKSNIGNVGAVILLFLIGWVIWHEILADGALLK